MLSGALDIILELFELNLFKNSCFFLLLKGFLVWKSYDYTKLNVGLRNDVSRAFDIFFNMFNDCLFPVKILSIALPIIIL